MTPHDLFAALAILPDDAVVTIRLRKADLLRALDITASAPEILSTGQAARVFGYTARRWREWAVAGHIDGAWQDDDGRWRLPRRSCEQWMIRRAARGRAMRPGRRSRAAATGQLEIVQPT